MEAQLDAKLAKLKGILAAYSKLGIAFSGGVDSSFLLAVAHEVLVERVLALVADSALCPRRELARARGFCEQRGIRCIVCRFDPFAVEGLAANTTQRCYLCKRALMGALSQRADEAGASCLAEGSNIDDLGDFRPGYAALGELGIASPLVEAGLSKSEIRRLSHAMGLPTWDKPSAACLASRIPYGDAITGQLLARVDSAEELLHDAGFAQVRVRAHGDVARIEVDNADFARLSDPDIRARLHEGVKACGFSYASVDLGGYRTGSLNPAQGA